MSDKNMNGKDFLLGAVVGTLLGAAAALLLAPKSGRELRGDISTQYHQVSDKTKQIASDVSDKTKQLATEVSEKTHVLANEVTERGQVLADKAKELGSKIGEELQVWNEGRKEAATSVTNEATSNEEQDTASASDEPSKDSESS